MRICPANINIKKTINIKPNIPLGQYPHSLLCGQLGKDPITNNTNKISSMSDKIIKYIPVSGFIAKLCNIMGEIKFSNKATIKNQVKMIFLGLFFITISN